MQKKDERIFIIIIFLIVIIGSIVFKIVDPIQKRRAEEKAELARLYSSQNKAFELPAVNEDVFQYHSAEEMELNVLVFDLYVFNVTQSKYRLTIDEVLDYLSEEYDADGRPRVLSRPESIDCYTAWYPRYRKEYFWDCEFPFVEYLKNHGYEKTSVYDMDYEEVIEALEKYTGDPEYVPPERKG